MEAKKAVPQHLTKQKHLKGWVKIPLPKQIEDKEHNMKQTKDDENKLINNKCPRAPHRKN